MTALAIKGSVDATDLAYIRNTLTKLEVLDLSMTDMVTLPGWGLGFHPDDGYQPNTTLKEVMLPASLVTIGKSAFLNCRALDYVDTGNAETITEYAFEGCSNLRDGPASPEWLAGLLRSPAGGLQRSAVGCGA